MKALLAIALFAASTLCSAQTTWKYVPDRANDAKAQCAGPVVVPYTGSAKFQSMCGGLARLMHERLEAQHLPCDSVSMLWISNSHQTVHCLVPDDSDIIGNRLVAYESHDDGPFKELPENTANTAEPSIEGQYWAPTPEERWAKRIVRAQSAQYKQCKELERTFKGDPNVHVAPCALGVPIAAGAAIEPGMDTMFLGFMRQRILAAHYPCDAVAWAMGAPAGHMPQAIICTAPGARNQLYWAMPGAVRPITKDELARELEEEGMQ